MAKDTLRSGALVIRASGDVPKARGGGARASGGWARAGVWIGVASPLDFGASTGGGSQLTWTSVVPDPDPEVDACVWECVGALWGGVAGARAGACWAATAIS